MEKNTKTRNADLEAQVRELTEKLETGVKEVFESDAYVAYLNAMSKFHHYSFGNVMLILMQYPDASVVAGFGSGKRNLAGRSRPENAAFRSWHPCSERSWFFRTR